MLNVFDIVLAVLMVIGAFVIPGVQLYLIGFKNAVGMYQIAIDVALKRPWILLVQVICAFVPMWVFKYCNMDYSLYVSVAAMVFSYGMFIGVWLYKRKYPIA